MHWSQKPPTPYMTLRGRQWFYPHAPCAHDRCAVPARTR